MKVFMWKAYFVLAVLTAVCFGFVNCNQTAGGDDIEEVYWTDPGPSVNDFITGSPIEPDWNTVTGFGGTVVSINPDQEYQTMKGFGASDCWSGNFVGRWGTKWYNNMNLSTPGLNADAQKHQIAEWLFSQEFDSDGNPKGIGLSEWRVNFGGGSWEQAWEKNRNSRIGTRNENGPQRNWNNMIVSWERNAESFLADIDLPYLDASGNPTADFNPNNIKINYDFENRQWGTQFWMKEAKKRGVETLVGFANSPPVPWTIGGTAINAAANSTYSGGRWTPYARDGGDNNDNSAGNLQSAHYDTYAHYLAGIADYFAKETVPDRYRSQPQDLHFSYLSPINEPQWEWNEDKQEGSRWSNWNIARVVRRLDAAITGTAYSGINANNTKILMPEACQWNFLNTGNITDYRNQIPAFFSSSNSGTYVGDLATMKPWTIGGHTYFTHANDSDLRSIRRGARTTANSYVDGGEALQVWSTEWCGLGGGAGNIDMNNYFHVGLFMAKMAFSDIIIGGSQTFSFWTALDMERGGGARYSMVAYSPGSAIYNHDSYLTNPVYKPGAVKSQSTLWAMGHYSLFVRPGFQRIGISGSGLTYEDNDNQPLDERAVMVTAYKSPPGHRDFVTNREVKRIVTVYVNMTSATRVVAAQFPNGYDLPIAIRCYVTNEQNTNGSNDQGRNGMRVTPHAGGIIQIPARSIFTAVYDFPVN